MEIIILAIITSGYVVSSIVFIFTNYLKYLNLLKDFNTLKSEYYKSMEILYKKRDIDISTLVNKINQVETITSKKIDFKVDELRNQIYKEFDRERKQSRQY
jgi:hypothetical protein